jgi:hypothetical protein
MCWLLLSFLQESDTGRLGCCVGLNDGTLSFLPVSFLSLDTASSLDMVWTKVSTIVRADAKKREG